MSIEIDQEGIMHRCHRFILPILAVIVMAGCSSPQVISATETTSHQPSKTPALTKTSTQLSPTRTSTPTTTLVSPPENILQYRPLEVLPDIPPDAKINDALVIYGDKPQILYFSSQRRIETFDIGKGFLFPISPDGKWLAYITVTGDTTETEWLVVESVDGKQRYINVLPDVLFFDSYLWLDNQHLIFPKFGSTYYEVKSMVVINPFTGEQIKLASVYPNLFPPEAGPAGRMNFNYSDVVYNPSLDLVIYPELNPPKNYIVLWDRRSGTALAKMETDAILEVYPLWSPDAKQVAVVNYQMRIVGSFIDEWFSISPPALGW